MKTSPNGLRVKADWTNLGKGLIKVPVALQVIDACKNQLLVDSFTEALTATTQDAKKAFAAAVITGTATTPCTPMEPAAMGTKGIAPANKIGAVAIGKVIRLRRASVSVVVQGGISSSMTIMVGLPISSQLG